MDARNNKIWKGRDASKRKINIEGFISVLNSNPSFSELPGVNSAIKGFQQKEITKVCPVKINKNTAPILQPGIWHTKVCYDS